MSEYRDAAWSYDPKDLELDKETGLPFTPTKKELDLFKKEKTNMYRGTWMVCFIYGLSALILLYIIFFTHFGKTYVYNTFLPAVITYVIGAIFIIIYLVYSIFALQPRQIGISVTSSVCPDFWKLKKSAATNDIIEKIKGTDYASTISKNDLSYKCVPDGNIYGDKINQIKNMKNEIYQDQLHSSTSYNNAIHKNTDTFTADTVDNNDVMYLFTNSSLNNETQDYEYNNNPSSKALRKYAEITGLYDPEEHNLIVEDGVAVKIDRELLKNNSLYAGNKFNYTDKKPLICSEVYPNVLNSLEYDVRNNDKLKCEYAKACNVSWSHLDCYENPK